MTTISREIRINAPKEKVWNALADFGGVGIYNPNVTNSYTTNGQNSGVGAERHCDLTFAGATVEERIVEWVDGESMIIEIVGGKKMPPFKSAYGSFSVRELSPNQTVVRMGFDYTLKFGPIGALMDAVMIKPQFGKSFGGLLAGLKHYVETGRQVDSPQGLDFTAVQPVLA